jgi:hypothetical protein
MTALKLAFWILVLLLALSFFGISIQAIVNSPAGQENFTYLSNLLSQFWQWSTQWIRPTV